MEQAKHVQSFQTNIAPFQAIYARLDRLEKEIIALKQLVGRYAGAPTIKAKPLGSLAKGSVVNEEDFAEARAWVFHKLETASEEM